MAFAASADIKAPLINGFEFWSEKNYWKIILSPGRSERGCKEGVQCGDLRRGDIRLGEGGGERRGMEGGKGGKGGREEGRKERVE